MPGEEFAGDDYEAFCFTVVRGIDLPELCRRLGGSADPLEELPVFEAGEAAYDDDYTYRPTVSIRPVDDAWLLIEVNGYLGAQEETLARLTTPTGEAHSAYWNVNSVSSLGSAVDGAASSESDPPIVHDVEPGHWTAWLMDQLEERSRTAIHAAWLEETLPTLVLPPL